MKPRTSLICSLGALAALHAGCAPSHDSIGGSEHGPRVPYRETGHSVLLLVDSRLYADEPKSLEARNYDLEWANLLGAHFGGCDIADLSRLVEDGSALLAGRQLLLLPRGCLAAMDSSVASLVDEAVRAGMSVLAELPDREWSQRVGLRRNALERRTPLPWPQADRRDPSRPEFREPAPRPLSLDYETGSYWPGRGALGISRSLPTPTGRPLLWQFDMGAGRWILLGMDFARLSSQLRQGRPDADLRIRNRHLETLPEMIQTSDLVAAPELLQADRPWLDRWSLAVLNDRNAATPWPRLWPCPLGASGWLLAATTDVSDWDAHPDVPFVARRATGRTVDSSFAPAGSAAGWLFGSGLPFRPLSTGGGLHQLWELPQLGAATDRSKAWLRRNREGAQGPITIAQPTEELTRHATESGYRFAEAREFWLFWTRRDASTLRWSFTDGLLAVEIDAPPAASATDDAAPLSLALPLRWRDRSLAGWELEGGEARSGRTRSFDRPYLLVELPAGRSRVVARYHATR